ncbi:MAG: hypothetical protein D3917_00785 [Candidatus Electrothrix sp. AX5]|nr:hypothetical protein [Candidatus Electrothrix sp. AX5]
MYPRQKWPCSSLQIRELLREISLRDDFQSEPRDDKKEEGEEFIEAEQEKSEVDQYARRGSEGVASM